MIYPLLNISKAVTMPKSIYTFMYAYVFHPKLSEDLKIN